MVNNLEIGALTRCNNKVYLKVATYHSDGGGLSDNSLVHSVEPIIFIKTKCKENRNIFKTSKYQVCSKINIRI